MKQKLLALVTVLALSLSLVGCHTSTPATVGSVGDIEISSGMYLISQFQAYQTVLGYANSEQSAMSASDFLKQTVYLAEDGTVAPAPAEGETQTGEARSVSAFVASETLANVQYYAAVETLFAQLGGTLTAEETAYAENYAEMLWSYYAETYEANGIGLNTLTEYQYVTLKNNALLELLYGPDGTEAVSDQDLTDYLTDELIYASHISVPMYNTSNYAFADETQQTEIMGALDALLADAETGVQNGTAATDAFRAAVLGNIGAAYDVMGNVYDLQTLVSSDVYTALYRKDTLAETYDETALASILALEVNEGTTFVETYTSAKAFMRIDPLESNSLDDLREDILVQLKSDELKEKLDALGTSLANGLDSSAMAKFSAKKIVTNKS